MEMQYNIITTAANCVVILLIYYTWRVLNWVWFRPKKLEKCLKQSGLKGNPYKLLYGDMKELRNKLKEAKSKPMNFSDGILQRIVPLFHHAVNKNDWTRVEIQRATNFTWEVLNWAWFGPKKCLSRRGLRENPYKLLYGNLNELTKSVIEAQSKPIKFL